MQSARIAWLPDRTALSWWCRAKLERLRQLADDHSVKPEAVHSGHVGDLGRVEAGLDELLAIFGGDDA